MNKQQIAQLLPEIFRMTLSEQKGHTTRDNPLDTLLSLMEQMHLPAEDVLDNLHTYFDPSTAPPRFLPYLAGWVDLDNLWVDYPQSINPDEPPLYPAGTGHLRELLLSAAYLSRWRGTAHGLLRFLTIATGLENFRINEHVTDENGQPRPFHVEVIAPSAAAPYRDLIQRIIHTEKPAHLTHTLIIDDAPPVDDSETDDNTDETDTPDDSIRTEDDPDTDDDSADTDTDDS
jgi:phage tail-like protein